MAAQPPAVESSVFGLDGKNAVGIQSVPGGLQLNILLNNNAAQVMLDTLQLVDQETHRQAANRGVSIQGGIIDQNFIAHISPEMSLDMLVQTLRDIGLIEKIDQNATDKLEISTKNDTSYMLAGYKLTGNAEKLKEVAAKQGAAEATSDPANQAAASPQPPRPNPHS